MVVKKLSNGCKKVAKRLQKGCRMVAKRLQNGCKMVGKAMPKGVGGAVLLSNHPKSAVLCRQKNLTGYP